MKQTKKATFEQSLDDAIEKSLKEETAQTKAVSSLIDVKDKVAGKLGSEIELKTDLSEKQVCIHTAVDILGHILVSADLMDESLHEQLTMLKERKSLSKDRKSRKEIVEVAKNPDMNLGMADERGGALKRFFSPKRRDV